jgi:hypothetical protein
MSDKAFIDCILNFSRNLENDSVSPDLQDVFFNLSKQRKTLPEHCTTGVIDSFLASLVSLVSINPDRTTTFNALSILFTYLKNGKPS